MVAKRNEDLSELLSVVEAAELLKVSPSTIRRWISESRLPSYRIGSKKLCVRRDDTLRLVITNPQRKSDVEEFRRYLVPNPYADPDRNRAIAEARAFQDGLLAKRGGRLFPSSVDDINEAREERTAQL